MRQQKICLNMIVKDESKVIERCLRSVKPLIDTWVIVDTGSTDGTQGVIRSFLKDIPGQLHERPWRDFSTNRNEAIALAQDKDDYLFVMDADDVVELEPDFVMPELTEDSYQLRVEHDGISHWRTHFFKPEGFYYDGVLHEALMSQSRKPAGRLEGIVYRRVGGGNRSQNKDKYLNDAVVLEAALKAEPDNKRYAFYLAQSWRDAGELENAMLAYERRAAMGGWAEEVYLALHEIGKLRARLGSDPTAAYLKAFEFRPTRAESLCNLAGYLRSAGRMVAAYPFAKAAFEISRPDDVLFVDNSVYTWRSLDELAISTYWIGRYDEGEELNGRLLGVAPKSELARIRKNLELCRAKRS